MRIPLDTDAATAALRAVLSGADSVPLGICCYNDDVAIAVLAAARSLGLRVPEDLALVGVDRTAVGQLITPRLSTVSVNQPLIMDALVQGLASLSTRRQAPDPARPEVDLDSLVKLVRGETT